MKAHMEAVGGAFVLSNSSEWDKLPTDIQYAIEQWLSGQTTSEFFTKLHEQMELHGLSDKQLAVVYKNFIPPGVTPSKEHMALIEKEWDKMTDEERTELTNFLRSSNWNLFKDFAAQVDTGRSLTDRQLEVVRDHRNQHGPAEHASSRWKALGKEGRERYTQYLSNRAQGVGVFVKSLYEQLLTKDYLTNRQLDTLDDIMRKDPTCVKHVDHKENVKSPGKYNLEGKELVDHMIRLWWKGEYHDVRVTDWSIMFDQYRVKFKDGTIKWVKLGNEKIEHVNVEEDKKAQEAPAFVISAAPEPKEFYLQATEQLVDHHAYDWVVKYFGVTAQPGAINVYINDRFFKAAGGLRRAKMDVRHLMKGR